MHVFAAKQDKERSDDDQRRPRDGGAACEAAAASRTSARNISSQRADLIRCCAMIDHMSLRVVDFQRAVEFYKAALAPLGYELAMEFPGYAGFGVGGKPDFWVTQTDKP